jgi:hypothetical protein
MVYGAGEWNVAINGQAEPGFSEGDTHPSPPEAEQHRIVAKVNELTTLIHRLEHHLTAACEAQTAFAAAAVHHLDA